MQLTQALTRAVQTRHRFAATLYKHRQRSWAQVGERVPRLAAGLRALGLRPGDRLAVLAFNSDNYIELFFAAAWANLVIVPLNTRWAIPENVYSLQDAGCAGLVVDDGFAAQVPELLKGHPMDRVVHMGDAPTPAGMQAYEALIARTPPMADECGRDDELCGIYYTGGTTGHPKGVMLSHKNFIAASINWIATLHFSDQTRYMHSAGLFHLAGASPAFALTLAGGTHVCLPKFDAVLAFEAIQTHRVNYVLFVPTMINMMLNHPDFERYDLSSVRYCEYGASPIPDAVLAAGSVATVRLVNVLLSVSVYCVVNNAVLNVTNVSSLAATATAPNTGASFTARTVRIKLSDMVAAPSLAVTSRLSAPLRCCRNICPSGSASRARITGIRACSTMIWASC